MASRAARAELALAYQAPENHEADPRNDQSDERQAVPDDACDREHEAHDRHDARAAACQHQLVAAAFLVSSRQVAQTAAASVPRPASSATRSRWSRAEP